MKILLEDGDIDSAINTYVSNLGVNLEGKTCNITITVGRGVNGTSATVEILDVSNKTSDGAVCDKTNNSTGTTNDSESTNENEVDEVTEEPKDQMDLFADNAA
jgi:hypothetical protein